MNREKVHIRKNKFDIFEICSYIKTISEHDAYIY